MKIRTITVGLILTTTLLSCKNDDNAELPPLLEFGIVAETLNSMVMYEQTVFNGEMGDINVYDPTSKILLMQSFKNGRDASEGFWTIRINGVDIHNQAFPYELKGVEGTIGWVDESIKKMQSPCAVPDVLCVYYGVGVDEVKITIDSVDSNIIAGKFEGKLYHVQVNPTLTRDPNDMVEVTEGSFKINYTSSPN